MPATDGLDYLLGGDALDTRPLPPHDPRATDFLAALSEALRGDASAKALPDVLTFAFWCRRANLHRLAAEFAAGDQGMARLGLGLVLHIAPANVPINFAYSFAFGLLAGNANLVRVPSRPHPQVEVVCAAIRRLLEEDRHAEIGAMTAFVRYSHSSDGDEPTARLSARCAGRVIWGGDQTIRRIRAHPLPAKGVDLAFPDRYSFCVLDADVVAALPPAALARLAEDFYNDTYLMDQNACSSPHLVVWLGTGERGSARGRFWAALQAVVKRRYTLAAVQAVEKYSRLLEILARHDDLAHVQRLGNDVYILGLRALPKRVDALRGRFGLFFEYDCDDLEELAPVVAAKFQTLGYFGVDKTRLRDLVIGQRLPGIDRIVPVGRALDIDVIWDGHDVVRTLSRIVDVR